MIAAIGWVDLAVLATSLVVVVLIGVKVSRRTRNLEDYLLGDRDLPWWAILGSIVATETSTATVLSVPGLAYGRAGLTFLQLAFGYVIGRAVVRQVLLPLYFQGRLFTAYQVLGTRFGVETKQLASLLFLVTRNLGDGLRLYLTALVLQQLAGWSFAASAITMGVVTIFYTYFGGMRSVVWNDCVQFVIYMIGAVAAVFVIVANIPGGWPAVWHYADAHDKLRVFDFRLSWDQPYNIWAGLIGGAVLTLGTHGTDHMMVQRYLSARSQRDAGKAIVLSGVVVLVQFAVFLWIGVELACYYAGHPEVTFTRTDQVFSHFIVNVFPRNTGLVGLMLAAILAAAMSTLSSSLNSSASALVNDFYLPRRRTPIAPAMSLAITRWMTVFFGIAQIGVAWWATRLTSAVVDNALSIAGFSAGLLLGVYALGVLTRSVGQVGAIVGATTGACALLCLQFLAPAVGLSRIAYPWLALVGSVTTFLVGLLVTKFYSGGETMRRTTAVGVVSAVVIIGAAAGIAARQAPAAPAAAGTQAAPPQPQTTLAPGLREVPDYRQLVAAPPAASIPEGFTSIFNGQDLTGWHISTTARHGIRPDFHVAHGMILGTQRPLGGGGLLITDKAYRDFELTMDVKPDWGCDSGFFFRTTENGAAYQITLDYLPGGSMGRLIQEGGLTLTIAGRAAGAGPAAGAAAVAGRGTATAAAGGATPVPGVAPPVTDPGMLAWKREDWNTVRIRVQGDAPRAVVWINGQQISDATDGDNHAVGGMIAGPIAIQIHGGPVRWQPGGFWRWRNIAVKELPR